MQELNPPPQRLGGSFPVRKAPVVPALVIAAQLVCAAVLCGWAFGIPGGSIVAGSVAGGRILMQPPTAVAGLGAGAGSLLV